MATKPPYAESANYVHLPRPRPRVRRTARHKDEEVLPETSQTASFKLSQAM